MTRAPKAGTPAEGPGRNGRVLVVDDQPELLAGLQMLLEMSGISMVIHDSMITLPLIVRQADPDVILIDLSLPALQGEAALRLRRNNLLRTDAIVLLFSGRGAYELAAMCERLGADGFIAKSDDSIDIVRALQSWIDQHRAVRAALNGGSNVATHATSAAAV